MADYYWDQLLATLLLVGDEQTSERLYHLGSGVCNDGKQTDVFVRPCLRALVRLDWRNEPVNCRSVQVDLTACDADGIRAVFHDRVMFWWRGSLVPQLDLYLLNMCDSLPTIHEGGTPRSWGNYCVTPLRSSIDSLFEYQLFDSERILFNTSADAGSLAKEWEAHTRSDSRYQIATTSHWQYDPSNLLYTHTETNDTMLRVRRNWGNMG